MEWRLGQGEAEGWGLVGEERGGAWGTDASPCWSCSLEGGQEGLLRSGDAPLAQSAARNLYNSIMVQHTQWQVHGCFWVVVIVVLIVVGPIDCLQKHTTAGPC
jgi:hypothetical protein